VSGTEQSRRASFLEFLLTTSGMFGGGQNAGGNFAEKVNRPNEMLNL
jgi:hypothetical protein